MSFFRSCSPIGLDVGARTVAAAQAVRQRSSWRLESASMISRPAGAPPDRLTPEESARLADILGRQGFIGRYVVAAAPQSKLMLSVLDLPPRSSGAPIDDLARSEMARTHRRDPASFEIACWDLPTPLRGSDTTHLMAAAFAHEDAAAMLDPIESSGLCVEALDVRAWAMARACERPLAGSSDAAALLDIGEAGVVLALVRSGVVVYERVLPDSGLGPVRARVAKALALEADLIDAVFATLLTESAAPDADASQEVKPILDEHAQHVVKELQIALGYVVHRYGGEVAQVLLHGPGATLRGLSDRISKDLGVPARIAHPAELIDCSPDIGASSADPAFAVAVGLARHPLAGDRRRGKAA
jgi:type IV pilus assembly protein PilM